MLPLVEPDFNSLDLVKSGRFEDDIELTVNSVTLFMLIFGDFCTTVAITAFHDMDATMHLMLDPLINIGVVAVTES